LRRHRIQVHLQTVGARGAGVGMRPALALALLLRSLHPAYRVGSVPESVRLRAALGAQAFASGWRRTGRRLLHGAHRLAEPAGAAAGTGLDQREPDAEFDATLAALEGLRLRPGIVWPAHRITWVYQAFGRLAQASSDATGPVPAADPTRLARARGAVRDLGRAANTPTLRAFHHCPRAAYLVLAGRPD